MKVTTASLTIAFSFFAIFASSHALEKQVGQQNVGDENMIIWTSSTLATQDENKNGLVPITDDLHRKLTAGWGTNIVRRMEGDDEDESGEDEEDWSEEEDEEVAGYGYGDGYGYRYGYGYGYGEQDPNAYGAGEDGDDNDEASEEYDEEDGNAYGNGEDEDYYSSYYDYYNNPYWYYINFQSTASKIASFAAGAFVAVGIAATAYQVKRKCSSTSTNEDLNASLDPKAEESSDGIAYAMA